VRDYSSFSIEKEEEIKTNIYDLKNAAYEVSKWAILGNASQVGGKSRLKNPLVEKYGEFAIDLGINNEFDTELNMSPEGKLRRKALYQKDLADKKFEDFSKKKQKPENEEKKLNLGLKRVEE